MKTMDVVLYKMPIKKGQESVADEWLDFLQAAPNNEICEALVSEKAYYEVYFKNVENETLYIYLVFSSANVAQSNEIAFNSSRTIDKKHFDYMKRCVDRENVQVLQSVIQANTWRDETS